MTILTSGAPTATITTQPGCTYAIKVNPVGTGTVSITDGDGDAIHADLTTASALQRKTFDAAGSGIVATANGPDGTTAHEITLTLLHL